MNWELIFGRLIGKLIGGLFGKLTIDANYGAYKDANLGNTSEVYWGLIGGAI